jgi:hypothetical protein
MFIIQKQLNNVMEYGGPMPLVKLDESCHCQVRPCYEGNKIASSVSYQLHIHVQ